MLSRTLANTLHARLGNYRNRRFTREILSDAVWWNMILGQDRVWFDISADKPIHETYVADLSDVERVNIVAWLDEHAACLLFLYLLEADIHDHGRHVDPLLPLPTHLKRDDDDPYRYTELTEDTDAVAWLHTTALVKALSN